MPLYFRFPGTTLGAGLLLLLSALDAPASAQQSAARVQTLPVQSSLVSDLPSAPDSPGGDGAGEGPSSVAPSPDPARIGGTVTDTNGDIVPGATVVLDSANGDHRSMAANDNAVFEFDNLRPGVPYHVTVQAKGFVDWQSGELRLHANEFQFVTGVRLQLLGEATSVIVTWSPEEIATEQVRIEEQQRVLGFIPNFYVVYDSKNAVPLTTRLKFELAYRTSIDPITIVGSAFLAGVNQVADTPDYPLGAKGYGERFGAVYAGGVTDILFGGAILPALLHQDPRYFYKGTGTTKSRILYALATPFICKGDNGKWQPNYSSVGGDLASSAISNAYYPAKDRGVGYTFGNFAINTAQREIANVVQEFVVKKLTPSAKKHQN